MDRGEHRQAAGAFAKAVIRSVELIVQPGARCCRLLLPLIASLEAIVQAKPNDVEAVVKKRAERNGPSARLAVQFLPGHRADLFAARSDRPCLGLLLQ